MGKNDSSTGMGVISRELGSCKDEKFSAYVGAVCTPGQQVFKLVTELEIGA